MIEKVVGDRYRIVRAIGKGGFGQTYLAEDINRFNERCVLKELVPSIENQDSLEKAKELFTREAEVLYKLQHPQIPRFREWFIEPTLQSMFLVQDYAEGPTYQDILRDRQHQDQGAAVSESAFSESEIVTLLMQLLPVLSYIHGRGVIHRDLSPDNLICRNSDRLPVLIDFGGVKEVTVSAAKLKGSVAPTDKDTVTLIGKPGYAPEEQMRRGQVSAASDLYALGVTALVLMIGKDPIDFYDAFHLTFDWRGHVKVSAGLAAILDKMVAHRVSERYTTAEQVLQDLQVGHPDSQPNGTPVPRSSGGVSMPSDLRPPQTVGSFKTLVVAPLGTAVVTSAAPPIERASMPVAGIAQGVSGWLWQRTTALLRSLLILLLLTGAVGLGWAAMQWWLKLQQFNPATKTDSPAPQTKDYSVSERQRKAQLIARLERTGVSSSFFYRLVNEAYYLQYPQQRGRLLRDDPQDEPLRANWDQVATQVLDAVEPLQPAVRDRLGRYTETDRTQWMAQLNAAGQDSRQFFEQAQSQLTDALPMYRGVSLRNTVALQLANGMAANQIQRDASLRR